MFLMTHADWCVRPARLTTRFQLELFDGEKVIFFLLTVIMFLPLLSDLSPTERLYAHHIARASFEGSLIILLQVGLNTWSPMMSFAPYHSLLIFSIRPHRSLPASSSSSIVSSRLSLSKKWRRRLSLLYVTQFLFHNIFCLFFSQYLSSISLQGFTEDEWRNFLIWAATVIYNHGNYKGFGDSKFIPNVSDVSLSMFSELIDSACWTSQSPEIKISGNSKF